MTRTVPIAAAADAAVGADPAERLARLMRPGALTLPALPPLSLYVHLPVVPAQVPVLRLQLARAARRATTVRPRRAMSMR